ncbi:MAG: beta-hydroxyacyl-ACP dehydratase [Desulfobulbaceae bacterium]|nr:beta-hydroxyacyl-ACP dehydratase [Desulfobulbaceae bacterium]
MEYSDKSLPLFRSVVENPLCDRERGTVSAEFCCPADFPPFSGHFPGQPVLPAVIQLVFVRLLASDLLQTDLQTVGTGRMKFKGMIRPGERINIQVALEKDGELWQALFKLKKMETVVTTGTIIFR